MFNVIVTQRVNPGSELEFEDLVRQMTEYSRTKDQGCMRFEWYRSEEPFSYVLVERWESKEAAVAHLAAEHVQLIFRRLKEISPERFTMNRIVPVTLLGDAEQG